MKETYIYTLKFKSSELIDLYNHLLKAESIILKSVNTTPRDLELISKNIELRINLLDKILKCHDELPF